MNALEGRNIKPAERFAAALLAGLFAIPKEVIRESIYTSTFSN